MPDNSENRHKVSIFRMLFLSQALLISIVLLVSMAASQRSYMRSTEEQSLTESRELIGLIGLNFSNYFSEARNAAYRIAASESAKMTCRSYADMSWAQRLPRVRELESQLSYTGILKNYIYSIAIVGQRGFHMVDSAVAAYSYDTIARLPYVSPYLANRTAASQYIPLHEYDYLPERQLPYVPKKLLVSVVVPVVVETRTVGCVILDLDYQRMRNIFELLNKDRGRSAYMIDGDGRYMFHRDSRLDGQPANSELLEHLAGQTGSFMLNEQDSVQTLYYRDEATGWYEVVETDYDHMMRYASQSMRYTYLLLGLGLAVGFMSSYIIAQGIRRPLSRLTARMDIIEQSGFRAAPTEDFYFSELNRISRHFEHMVQRVNQLIENEYVANARQKDAAFKALQAQITPHFMQNTLQMVKSEIVLGHTQEAGRVITMLGRLLNYSMHNSKELSPVRRELDYIVNYLEIFKKRLDGRVDYSIHIEDQLDLLMLPRMSLQPLIENCIKYGGEQATEDAPLFIRIYGRRQGDELLLSVYDNGPGMAQETLRMIQNMLGDPDATATDNIGIINTHQRIRHCYGPSYGLSIQSEAGVYTQTTLHFPFTAGTAQGKEVDQ